MITKSQRNQIKKILGNNYSDEVSKELDISGVVNRKGSPHTSNMIRRVMNGLAHAEIEKAIYSAVERKNIEKIKEKKRREAILEQTKTGAATPA